MFGKNKECKHKFQPRYDEIPAPNAPTKIKNFYGTAEDLRALMFYRVYVYDICTKCGEVTHRQR